MRDYQDDVIKDEIINDIDAVEFSIDVNAVYAIEFSIDVNAVYAVEHMIKIVVNVLEQEIASKWPWRDI